MDASDSESLSFREIKDDCPHSADIIGRWHHKKWFISQVIKTFCTRQLFKTLILLLRRKRTIFTWLHHNLWLIRWGGGSITRDVRLPLCAHGIRKPADFHQPCKCHRRLSSSLSLSLVSWRHNSERIYRPSRRGEESTGDVLGLPVWSPVRQAGERQHFQHSRQGGEKRGRPFLRANR